MGLGFAERRACCLLRLPGSGREGAGRDAPPELRGETPGRCSGCGASGCWVVGEGGAGDPDRKEEDKEGCGRGCGQGEAGAGGNDVGKG